MKAYTAPLFNLTIGTVSFIIKKWSVGLKWMWMGEYHGISRGRVR